MSTPQNEPSINNSPMPSPKERVLGALLGVHAGDCLGAPLEFESWESIRRRYPKGLRDLIGGGPFEWSPGEATDDTDLTYCILMAYRDAALNPMAQDTSNIVRSAGEYMLKWQDGDWPGRVPGFPPRDIGNSTSLGLEKWRYTKGKQGGAGVGRTGNGSLMRCIPTALFIRDRSTRIEHSVRISAITHDDPRCTGACATYTEMVAGLLEGKSPSEAVNMGLQLAQEIPSAPAVATAIQLGQNLSPAELAAKGPRDLLPDSAGGYVLDSLTLAVAAVLDPRPPVDVMVDICRVGGDTDTNTAIAGGILGARDGVHALPELWLRKLQFRREFEEIALALLG